ncbi:MAG: VanZ family protein [Desulforegulaceae bacterium]|nr:VanZ family protein [Desulforegulaceae bacterium]
MKPGFLRILYLIYLFLLVYASLVPFDFFSEVNFDNEFYSFWNHWPFNINSRISGSDVLSNLILYTPLGFLITLEKILNNNKKSISFLFAVLFCSTISFCVEITQMFIQFRVPGASDWLFNTISGVFGALSAVFFGQKLWNYFNKYMDEKKENRAINLIAFALIILFCMDAFTPFIPSILLKDVWRSLKISEFSISQGFLFHPWHWWLIKILLFAFFTIIISEFLKKRTDKKIFVSISFVVIFSIFLEIGKIFIKSRYFNIANIASAFGGVCFGWTILSFFYKKISLNQKLNLCLAFILIYIFYLGWYPFNFELDFEVIKKRIPSIIRWLPFYDYALGAGLNHAALFFQGIVFQFLLILILKLRFGWFEKNTAGIFGAVCLSACLAFLQEGGQLMISSRTPSPADIYCFAFGGGLCAGLIKNENLKKDI